MNATHSLATAMESSTPFLPKEDTSSEPDVDYSDDDIDDMAEKHRKHQRRCCPAGNIMKWLLTTWGLISLCWYAFRTIVPPQLPSIPDVYRPSTLNPGLRLCDCGNTISQALSQNCAYDSLSTAWLPPHCRDDALTTEFDRAGPGPEGQWSYFADGNGTLLLTKAEIAMLGETGGSFWSSRDWHIAHCVFYWQKYKRMEVTGVVMEERFDSLKHVRHCSRLIMAERPDYFFLIEVPVRMNGSVDERPRMTRISGMLPNGPE